MGAGRMYSGDDGLCISVSPNGGDMGWASIDKRCKESIVAGGGDEVCIRK